MTRVITRYFEDADAARELRRDMIDFHGFAPSIVSLHDSADGLSEVLTAAQVDADAAKAYAAKLAKGGAVLMVKAGYRPLNVAKTTRQVTAAAGAADMGDLSEEVYVKDPLPVSSSIFTDHRHIFYKRRDPDSTNYYQANWPIPLISRRRPADKFAFPRHARMANKPIDLLIPDHAHQAGFPIGHIVPGHKYMAKFPFAHIVPGHKYMAKFPFAHIVPGHKHMAKFPFGHIVPGHKFMAKFPFGHIVPHKWRRMANWPFPLLINDKAHTNSLMPKAPRMANFPIGLLVPGQRFMAKFPFAHIVPGHRYMAKFPFAHIIPGHKHQADMILPLIIRRDDNDPDPQKGFSLSKMFGWKTVIRR